MFLSITASRPDGDATGLGYLMAKHPDRVQSFALSYGTAWVYYPQATPERTTFALQVEVDPVGLVRNKRFRAGGFTLAAYVNDRPYAASSMLAVAIKRVLGTALKGTCQARPDLVDVIWDLEINLGALPACQGLAELFEPLGWHTDGAVLRGRQRIADALAQLYVLLPVLDGSKHYWVDEDEVTKLVTHGGDWLPSHPLREEITNRYLAGQRSLVAQANQSLDEEPAPPAASPATPLAALRREAIAAVLADAGARTVVDVGCGEGRLISHLLTEPRIEHVLGLDVSASELAKAERHLHLDTMPDRQRARVTLAQSSLTYIDPRLADADAVVAAEVIEHLDPPRLGDLERTVFALRPRHVILTTPNAEYNAVYGLVGSRHPDHRFEWTRDEFRDWAEGLAQRCGYRVAFRGVGGEDPTHGTPTQLAWFEAQQ
ncbi:MAG: 3' terminal RNA ribose 2'-O-methyltransferase Hen1 [Propionibacteriaceae bacterium]|nr:3' terminal RNA ribose 2'-O-methyltransferase Hen1 [Propionibacteriaceae bacterium]